MPDAHGNIKGIALSVSEEKWARIFGPSPEVQALEVAALKNIVESSLDWMEERHQARQANRDNNSDPR